MLPNNIILKISRLSKGERARLMNSRIVPIYENHNVFESLHPHIESIIARSERVTISELGPRNVPERILRRYITVVMDAIREYRKPVNLTLTADQWEPFSRVINLEFFIRPRP